LKDFFCKYREIITYLFFGVLTTAIGWAVYFAMLWGGKALFHIPASVTSGAKYMAVYTAAQVVQWCAAVMFAFYTNRRWVFTDADRTVPVKKQLPAFAAGRLFTFFLDYAITYGGALFLTAIAPSYSDVYIAAAGRSFNINEAAAKVVAAIVVIICNYIFSKLFVFKRKPVGEGSENKT